MVSHWNDCFYKDYNFIVKNPIIVSSETSRTFYPLPEFDSGSGIIVIYRQRITLITLIIHKNSHILNLI